MTGVGMRLNPRGRRFGCLSIQPAAFFGTCGIGSLSEIRKAGNPVSDSDGNLTGSFCAYFWLRRYIFVTTLRVWWTAAARLSYMVDRPVSLGVGDRPSLKRNRCIELERSSDVGQAGLASIFSNRAAPVAATASA